MFSIKMICRSEKAQTLRNNSIQLKLFSVKSQAPLCGIATYVTKGLLSHLDDIATEAGGFQTTGLCPSQVRLICFLASTTTCSLWGRTTGGRNSEYALPYREVARHGDNVATSRIPDNNQRPVIVSPLTVFVPPSLH